MWFAEGEHREGNKIYDLTIIADVIISALLSIGFLVYGVLLFCVSKNTDDGETSDTRAKELMKVFIHLIAT
jgi:hypothetical protein